jgi:hypothetical protein
MVTKLRQGLFQHVGRVEMKLHNGISQRIAIGHFSRLGRITQDIGRCQQSECRGRVEHGLFPIDFRRISQKRVDYAIYDRELALVAVVELDDRTHDAARDAVRDAYLASAGIRTIRFQSKAKPDGNGIRAALSPSKTRVQATERSSLFSQV